MTIVPDYVFPIIGRRVWQWDATGVKSLNGIAWRPGKPFAAECRTPGCHQGPQAECTCGVYASRSLEHLRRLGYMEHRLFGEVSLWGRVVEHEDGWRAQFAYPKNFGVPVAILPSSIIRIESWLAVLMAYRCDIFLFAEKTVPLWLKESGFHPQGTELIVQRCRAFHDRRRGDHRLNHGDRVAVLGHGIAVIEHMDGQQVRAILGGRSVLTVERQRIAWCEQCSRWETAIGASIGLAARKEPQSSASF